MNSFVSAVVSACAIICAVWGQQAELELDDACLAGTCELDLLQRRGAKLTVEKSEKTGYKGNETESGNETVSGNESESGNMSGQGEAAAHDSFAPLYGQGPAVQSYPHIQLAPWGHPPPGPVLANGLVTRGISGVHVRRNMLSVTGHDLTVSDDHGGYMYGSEGNFFTLHSRTHMYEARTGRPLAEITSPIFHIHRKYEIGQLYFPICPGQSKYESTSLGDVYPFARITKRLLTMYAHYDVERYNCDGSLTPLWEVKSTHWASMKVHYTVTESGSSYPIGTIDQPSMFQLTANYDSYVSANEDLTLFAAVTIIMDMSILKDEKAADESAQNHVDNSYYDDGRRRRRYR